MSRRTVIRRAAETAPPADGPGPATELEPPAGRSVWANLNRPFVVGFLLTLGALAALVLGFAVRDLATVWVYIAFALFIALGLDPLVRRLEGAGLSRAWSIVVVFFGFALVIGGVLWLIIPTVVTQIAQFVSNLPGAIRDFQRSDMYAWIDDRFGAQAQTLLGDVQAFLTDPGNIAAIGGGVLQVGASIATTLSGMLIVLVLSLYFVATLDSMKRAFYRLLPARNRSGAADITDEITASVGGYLGGMVVLAFMNAVFAFIMHLVLGLPFPMLMAVVAFCITLIPLIGTVLFWVVASSLALFTSPVSALVFAAAYLVYMQVEAYVLTPRVMNKTISVPGSLVVIGALVGGTLMGLLGALVAIPVTASILLIVKRVFIPRQDAKV